jgi:hypothetical protein
MENILAYNKRVLKARGLDKLHFEKGPFFVQSFFGPGKKGLVGGLQGGDTPLDLTWIGKYIGNQFKLTVWLSEL